MADEIQSDLPDDLQQFESLLRDCTPSTPQLDRDRLMYLAGRASVEAGTTSAETLADVKPSPLAGEAPRGYLVRGNAADRVSPLHESGTRYLVLKTWAWPLASAALLLLSLTLGAAILFRRAETRIVYVNQPAASVTAVAAMPVEVVDRPADTDSEPNYLQLRNLVLAHGVEALPAGYAAKPSQHADEIPLMPLWRQDF